MFKDGEELLSDFGEGQKTLLLTLDTQNYEYEFKKLEREVQRPGGDFRLKSRPNHSKLVVSDFNNFMDANNPFLRQFML
jgi:hypothetical protein